MSVAYRREIDGLRAIAVLAVVAFHAKLGVSGGYTGVDVFFVISGFLITKIIYDQVSMDEFSFVDFYDRRIRRLFPALFVMMLLVSAWALAVMIFLDLRDFGRALAAATVYLSNAEFYQTADYFRPIAETQPLLHTWSLAVEEQFYIVAPVGIMLLARFVKRPFHLPVIIAAVIASYAYCIALTDGNARAAFYLPVTRAWELGLGALVALSSRYLKGLQGSRPAREIVSLLALVAVLAPLFILDKETVFPGWVAAIPTVGTALLLAVNGNERGGVVRVLSLPPFVFVGKISYSLYLWHWPILLAAGYGRTTELPMWQALLCVAISFVMGFLSYRFVESPIRKRRILGTPSKLFLAAALASLVAIALGVAIILGCVFRTIVTGHFGIVTGDSGDRDRPSVSDHRDRPFRHRDRPFRDRDRSFRRS